MSNIIPFKEPPKHEPTCSFCKKQKAHVKNLVASHDNFHYICNECITKATERLKQNE